jgi:uncharacterized protein (TIGR03032 family)
MKTSNRALFPFSCTYTPQLPELLLKLNCSIAFTTHQAGKLVFISPVDENSLTMLPRSFNQPMGFEVGDEKMVLATKDEVILFENSRELAVNYPNRPGTYDSLFVPRMTFHTGQVDLHDIAFGTEGIWAVNTSFSCICQVNGSYNFIPTWKPSFISQLVSEDRCHLNGLVMLSGKPAYVTMLGNSDTPQGWRNNIMDGGLLIDIEKNEIILDNLPMPHSPMIYEGDLYVLLSASGDIIKIDLDSRSYEVIKRLDGFCRGMDIYGDYMFVGMSKLRRNSSAFSKLSFSGKADTAGVKIIHLPTRALVGEIIYQTSLDEIYGLKILADTIRPNILNTINPVYKYSLAIPGATFWANPEQEIHENQ